MRRKLTGAATALVTAALVSLAGCSGATPLAGGSSASVDASSATANSAAGPAPGSASGSAGAASGSAGAASGSAASVSPPGSPSGAAALPGLSTGCTAAVKAQAGVADIFGRAVDGTKLTAKAVSAVFDTISAGLPPALTGDLATLRDAARRSVGKSDVAVAEILQEKEVGAARATLSEYVQECSPPTS